MKIGAVGPRGTYSSEVADKIGGDDYVLIETDTNVDTIKELSEYDIGILPILNKYGGSVSDNMATLYEQVRLGNNIRTLGFYNHEITHVLAISSDDSMPKRMANQVAEVYSYSQALKQCRQKIIDNDNFPREVSSTTAKIGSLSDGQGVICSKKAAQDNNLIIVDANYAPVDNNVASFAVLTAQQNINLDIDLIINDKVIAIGEAPEYQAGSLKMLQIFYELGMSLCFIESVANSRGGFLFPIVAEIPEGSNDIAEVKMNLTREINRKDMHITIL